MYDPQKQYRCTIIRGRAQTELENLLPAYCRIVDNICPTTYSEFRQNFNKLLSNIIHNYDQKVLDNHRTEIAGKLFGLWYKENDIVYISEKAKQHLELDDNPLFFKDIAIKLQFPNGMDKIQNVKQRISDKIRFRPTPFLLALLKEAQKEKINIYESEIAYYVLNSYDVLSGKAEYKEVLDKIIQDRKNEIVNIVSEPGKATSYSMQHIREQLKLLELANLINTKNNISGKIVSLNNLEEEFINAVIKKYLYKNDFDAYIYDLENEAEKKEYYEDWSKYYTSLLKDSPAEQTKLLNIYDKEKLENPKQSLSNIISPNQIGDEGENIVMEFEKNRVSKYSSRLTNKVIHLGKQRGLGYDISSIVAEGINPERAIYIEVKTTKRTTKPPNNFSDQFDMTRNEWIAADQHRDYYFIYRVYIFKNGIQIVKLASPAKLKDDDHIFAEPLKYHIEFKNKIGKIIYE